MVEQVRIEIYRSFVDEGRPPTTGNLATELDASVDSIESALSELDSTGVIALMPGTNLVWLAHPFAASASPFRVETSTRGWDAICVWDGLGILAMLEMDGRVTTGCPDCDEELEIEIRGGAPTRDDYVVHYGVPAARWYEDIGHT